jgi:hypothetical protein
MTMSKKSRRELVQPLLGVRGELVHVGDDDVAFLADGQVARVECSVANGSTNHCFLGEDVTFPPEALLSVRDVQGLEESFLDREVRRDDQGPSFRDAERRDCRDAGLPHPTGIWMIAGFLPVLKYS